MFFWFRILNKQFVIWRKAVECCRYLIITGRIIDIISMIPRDMQTTASEIERQVSVINAKTEELKKETVLNPVIREKMEEYYNKTLQISKN